MPEGWERYGVEDNVFESEPVLDCVRKQADRDRFGAFFFSDEELRELDRQLRSAIRQEAIGLYVVTGPSGSGRTAFARKLVQRYAELRSVDFAKFAFAEYDPQSNVSAPQVLNRLVTSLANEVRALTAAIGQDLSAELRESLKSNPPSSFDEIVIQGDLRSLSMSLARANGGFGCLLENVPRADMITLGRTLFEKSNAILVFTVRSNERNEVILPLETAGNTSFVEITMPHLTPRQTWDALEHRWKKWQALDKIPLPQPAVENYVAVPPPTMGWLLTQAALMFEHKLSSHPEGEVWPNDPVLGFDETEVKSTLAFVRRFARRGQR